MPFIRKDVTMIKRILATILLTAIVFLGAENSAQAQKLGPTTPWLGWRPLGPRFGIHYSTIHIYPTDGSPYINPSSRYEPIRDSVISPPATVTPYGQVRVLVPDAAAKVWFDGEPTTSTGLDRLYYTPPLSLEKPNTYRIRASWPEKGQPVIQEIVISVRPGETAIADFASRRLP
jgi:uncharacterized protein (TIGR03000 family)